MKKIFRTAVSLLLCSLILVQGTAVLSGAFTTAHMTEDEWNAYYASLRGQNTLPTVCVGADETQLNFVWHTAADKAFAKLRLATNPTMTDAKEFVGTLADAETAEQKLCRVTVSGISENTTYYYQWYTDDDWSDSYQYKTGSFTDYKMLIVGDIQIGGQTQDNSDEQSRIGYAWQNLLDEALSKNPDVRFLLSPGDNTSTGKSADEWQTLLMPESLRSLPLALAIGNHDKKGFSYNYYTNMPNEYYGKHFEGLDRDFWFTYGDVLYLVFDATSGSAIDHKAMAKEAVAENPDAKWKIAVMHQAPYSPGVAALDPETSILLNGVFQPIFNMYDVDLVLTGHTHCQGRSHFIADGILVGKAESGAVCTNPKGIVYLNSNAVCDRWSAIGDGAFTAYSYVDENPATTYTTLEFANDEMLIKTFNGNDSTLLDSLTIRKTDGYNDMTFGDLSRYFFYCVVELLGLVYMKIDKVVVAIRGGHF